MFIFIYKNIGVEHLFMCLFLVLSLAFSYLLSIFFYYGSSIFLQLKKYFIVCLNPRGSRSMSFRKYNVCWRNGEHILLPSNKWIGYFSLLLISCFSMPTFWHFRRRWEDSLLSLLHFWHSIFMFPFICGVCVCVWFVLRESREMIMLLLVASGF